MNKEMILKYYSHELEHNKTKLTKEEFLKYYSEADESYLRSCLKNNGVY